MTVEEWKEAKRARARDAAARRKRGRVGAGVDIDKAVAAFRKHDPFIGNLGAITVDVGHRSRFGSAGRAWVRSRRMRIAIGANANAACVLELIVHEMVHLACPAREHHGERFRRSLQRAAREIWQIEVTIDPPSTCAANKAYEMDRLIVAQLKDKIERGEVDTFPAAPAEPPKPRAVVMASLVERRAAHAVKMLAAAEKKAKSAQRSLSKWKKKVSYYDRMAAKRGDKA